MKRTFFLFALIAGCLLFCGTVSAQLVLGQYEDEAPLGTWNIFGAASAPSVGLGGTQFARAGDASVSLTNPSLLLALPRISAAASGSYTLSSLFKFSLVNTGVVASTGTPTAGVFGADYGGLAIRTGEWAFSLAVAILESYGRPRIAISDSGYELDFDQTGYLRVFHAAIARRLPGRLSVGLGIGYAAGRLDRTLVERSDDTLRVVTITDDKVESYRGLFFNGGLTWEPTGRLKVAFVVRSPYIKKGTGRSLLRYEVPTEGTDIRIDAEAANSYSQPWIFGGGVSFRLTASWSFAVDTAYYGWSRYRVTYFGEPLERAFRNIVKAGAGVEYLAPTTVRGRSARIPFRLGFSLDPQPMTTVRSSYRAVTFGTGLELGALAIDVSASVGREKGSGDALKANRIVLSIRYIVRE